MSRVASFASALTARSFAMLLAFALSLGALPCVASGPADGDGIPTDCCPHAADQDTAVPDSTMPADVGVSSNCHGTCPGAGVLAGTDGHIDTVRTPAMSPSDTHLAGRSLVPDPPPPRAFAAARAGLCRLASWVPPRGRSRRPMGASAVLIGT
jgi:hypothetical protein